MSTSKTQSQRLRHYLREAENEINRALFFLREINAERWHDRVLNDDEHELVRFVDRHIHPTYLRLTEAVLAPLTRPVAFFSRLARGKGTDGLVAAKTRIQRTTPVLIGVSVRTRRVRPRFHPRGTAAHGRRPLSPGTRGPGTCGSRQNRTPAVATPARKLTRQPDPL